MKLLSSLYLKRTQLIIVLFLSSMLGLQTLSDAKANLDELVPKNNIPYYVRMVPCDQLFRKMIPVVNTIAPDFNADFMCNMFLGSLGYPEFQNLAANTQIGLFFLSNPETPTHSILKYTSLLKNFDFDAKAPLVAVIKPGNSNKFQEMLIQYTFVCKEYKGWLFVTNNIKNLDFIKDYEELIKLTQVSVKHDIECIVKIDPSGKLPGDLSKIAGNEAYFQNVEGIRFAFDMEVGTSINFIKIGVNLRPDTISTALEFHTYPNTALNKLFSQKLDPLNQDISLLDLDTSAYIVTHLNPEAFRAYLQSLYARYNHLPALDPKRIKQVVDACDEYLNQSAGCFIDVVSMPKSMQAIGDKLNLFDSYRLFQVKDPLKVDLVQLSDTFFNSISFPIIKKYLAKDNNYSLGSVLVINQTRACILDTQYGPIDIHNQSISLSEDPGVSKIIDTDPFEIIDTEFIEKSPPSCTFDIYYGNSGRYMFITNNLKTMDSKVIDFMNMQPEVTHIKASTKDSLYVRLPQQTINTGYISQKFINEMLENFLIIEPRSGSYANLPSMDAVDSFIEMKGTVENGVWAQQFNIPTKLVGNLFTTIRSFTKSKKN